MVKCGYGHSRTFDHAVLEKAVTLSSRGVVECSARGLDSPMLQERFAANSPKVLKQT
jgi:hypothetical protein